MKLGIPVDESFAPIDEALFVEADEHLLHRVGQAIVHREPLLVPIQGRAQAAELAGNGTAGLRPPFPNALDEGIATEILTGLVFRLQLPLYHHLGRDPRMVRARLPQSAFTFHTVVAHQGIHHGIIEPVAHVKAARDVGRRDHDAVGTGARVGGPEIAVFLPPLIPALFDGMRFVRLFHGFTGSMSWEEAKH